MHEDAPRLDQGSFKCPNHHEPLAGISPLDLAAGKGTGICPISGAKFEWAVNPETKFKDKFGNWHVRAIVTGGNG